MKTAEEILIDKFPVVGNVLSDAADRIRNKK